MELKKSKTFENLKKAFIAECCARTRYEFVEYGERYNGYEGIATVIDEIAYQEFNHARMLYTQIQNAVEGTIDNEEVCVSLPFRQKWDLLDNLKFTAEDEGDEAVFYEKASKTDEEEGFPEFAKLFTMINAVELKHKKILLFLHDKFKNGDLYKAETNKRWTCPACGYELTGEEVPEKCPLCQAKAETFRVNFPKELML
ncbi:MAG: rubrerythrin family protein [Clostridia bacterium]|nr:rubrerythrin family protein [Clostridia bacterium]